MIGSVHTLLILSLLFWNAAKSSCSTAGSYGGGLQLSGNSLYVDLQEEIVSQNTDIRSMYFSKIMCVSECTKNLYVKVRLFVA